MAPLLPTGASALPTELAPPWLWRPARWPSVGRAQRHVRRGPRAALTPKDRKVGQTAGLFKKAQCQPEGRAMGLTPRAATPLAPAEAA